MTRNQQKLMQGVRNRHGRRKLGVFLGEGLRCCREGLSRHAAAAELVLCSRTFADSPAFAEFANLLAAAQKTAEILPDHEFDRLAVTENPQGILCLFHDLPLLPAGAPPEPFILILDRVTEPGNLGTILRTAWAVGLREVWFTAGTTDPFGPKAIRAGMGAQFALGLREFPALAECRGELRRHGWRHCWCSTPREGVNCFNPEFDLRQSGLVIGNEADGIQDLADADRVTIPMPGQAESLNAAQAATILLFEAVRRGILS